MEFFPDKRSCRSLRQDLLRIGLPEVDFYGFFVIITTFLI